MAKRVDFSLNNNSFARFFLQRSNFTQHHSTPLDSLNKVAKRLDFFLDFLSSKKSSEKSNRLARALHVCKIIWILYWLSSNSLASAIN